jgi:ribosomal protein L37AE/L43A
MRVEYKKITVYKCKHCGKVVERESDKQWIKSYCETKGKTVRLVARIINDKT